MTRQEIKEIIISIIPDTNGCLNWPLYKNEKGYGRVWIDKCRVRAHRISYELFTGPIPYGMLVLHKCPNGENTSCVNPAHLKVGDVKENVCDCILSGKHASNNPTIKLGEGNPASKLTALIVLKIRELWKMGKNSKMIANEFSVSRGCIRKVISGKSWSHIQ